MSHIIWSFSKISHLSKTIDKFQSSRGQNIQIMNSASVPVRLISTVTNDANSWSVMTIRYHAECDITLYGNTYVESYYLSKGRTICQVQKENVPHFQSARWRTSWVLEMDSWIQSQWWASQCGQRLKEISRLIEINHAQEILCAINWTSLVRVFDRVSCSF